MHVVARLNVQRGIAMRRVVITGMGAVTPLGNDVESTWQGAVEGRSGVDFMRAFDTSEFPVHIAAEVKDFDLNGDLVPAKELKRLDRNVQFALAAAKRGARPTPARTGTSPTVSASCSGRASAGCTSCCASTTCCGARPRSRLADLPAERPSRLGERPGRDRARTARAQLRRRLGLRDGLARHRRGRRARAPRPC